MKSIFLTVFLTFFYLTQAQYLRTDVPSVSGGSKMINSVISDGNGGYIIAGNFTHVGATARNNIARIKADGTLDASWYPSGGVNNTIWDIMLDGTIIWIVGQFTEVGGYSKTRIATINLSDGSVGAFTTTNAPNANVYCIAKHGSNYIVGGEFTLLGATSRNYIGAYLLNGNISTYTPNANGTVRKVLVNGDDIWAAGTFTTIGGSTRKGIAKIRYEDGWCISTFNASLAYDFADPSVYEMKLVGTNLYISGGFNDVGTSSRDYWAQVDASTGACNSWNPNGGINTLYGRYGVNGTNVFVAGSSITKVGDSLRTHIGLVKSDVSVSAWKLQAVNQSGSPYYSSVICNDNDVVIGASCVTFGVAQSCLAWVISQPETQSSNLNAYYFRATEFDMAWVKGDGKKSVVFITKDTATNFIPTDGVDYTANSDYSLGTNLGNNWKCIYNGTSNTTAVSCLTYNTSYKVVVYDYNYNTVVPTTTTSYQKRILTNKIIATTPDYPVLSTTAISSITNTSASSGGNITFDGRSSITARGICYNTTGTPTLSDTKTSNGTGTGTFSSTLSLDPNVYYYVRAYATNVVGTSYGNEQKFWSKCNTPLAPVLSRLSDTSLQVNIATDGNPATATYAIYETTTSKWVNAQGKLVGAAVYQTKAAWGDIIVTGLSYYTTYTFYVRAKNGNGDVTSSEPTASERTMATHATITTINAYGIKEDTLTFSGNLIANGGDANCIKGICYSTVTNPTLIHDTIKAGSSLGVFNRQLILQPNTKFYYRAYATNEFSTSYGDEYTVTTLPVKTSITFSAITKNSVDIALTTYNNPLSVTYLIYDYSTGLNVQSDGTLSGVATYRSASEWGSTISVKGLASNVQYKFYVYAKGYTGTTGSDAFLVTTLSSEPTVTFVDVTSIADVSATANINITSDGGSAVTERGVVFDTTANPDINDSKVLDGTGAGLASLSLTSLLPNTKYYIKAYAKNSIGASYSSELNFTTLCKTPLAPVVSSPTSTTLNVSIAVDGNPSSTLYAINEPNSDFYVQANGTLASLPYWATKQVLTNILVKGLTSNNTYSFKVKAKGIAGIQTVYSEAGSGTTKNAELTVITIAVTSKPTELVANAEVTDDGGLTITSRGFVYNRLGTPTIDDSKVQEGSGKGEYTSTITLLPSNTRYFVRSYVQAGTTTVYGAEISIFTKCNIPSPVVVNMTNPMIPVLSLSKDDVNPDYTPYGIYEVLSGKWVKADGTLTFDETYQEYSQWKDVSLSSLTMNKSYQFVVKCKNGDGAAVNSEITNVKPTGINNSNLSVVNIFSYDKNVVIENAQGFNVSIYSISGALIYQNVLREDYSIIDLSHVSTGIYLVQVVKENEVMNKKVLVQ